MSNSTKLRLIFTEKDIRRISLNKIQTNNLVVTIDVHGMKCYEAKRFINNLVNLLLQTDFQLIVIHGYRHGTSIKDMLATNYDNNRVYKQHIDPNNQGVTHMYIAA